MNTISELKKKLEKNKKKPVIQREAALDQVAMFLEYYEVDVSDKMNDIQESAFGVLADGIIDQIMKGKIEIKNNDSGEPILAQLLGDGQVLEYSNSISQARARADFSKSDLQGAYQLAGYLCGIGEDGIKNLTRPDSRVSERIGAFFLIL